MRFRIRSDPSLEKSWKKLHGEISCKNYFPTVDCPRCGVWISPDILPVQATDLKKLGIPICRSVAVSDYNKFCRLFSDAFPGISCAISGSTILPVKIKKTFDKKFIMSAPLPGILLLNSKMAKDMGVIDFFADLHIPLEDGVSLLVTPFIDGTRFVACDVCGRSEMAPIESFNVPTQGIFRSVHGGYVSSKEISKLIVPHLPPGFIVTD